MQYDTINIIFLGLFGHFISCYCSSENVMLLVYINHNYWSSQGH